MMYLLINVHELDQYIYYVTVTNNDRNGVHVKLSQKFCKDIPYIPQRNLKQPNYYRYPNYL